MSQTQEPLVLFCQETFRLAAVRSAKNRKSLFDARQDSVSDDRQYTAQTKPRDDKQHQQSVDPSPELVRHPTFRNSHCPCDSDDLPRNSGSPILLLSHGDWLKKYLRKRGFEAPVLVCLIRAANPVH